LLYPDPGGGWNSWGWNATEWEKDSWDNSSWGSGSFNQWTPGELNNLVLWVHSDDLNTLTGVEIATDQSAFSGADWAYSEGVYTHEAGVGNTADLISTGDVMTVGLPYRISYKVANSTAGTVTVSAGTTQGTQRTGNATYSEDLLCMGNVYFLLSPSEDFDGEVSVISIKYDKGGLSSDSLLLYWPPRYGNALYQDTVGYSPIWNGFNPVLDGTDDYLFGDTLVAATGAFGIFLRFNMTDAAEQNVWGQYTAATVGRSFMTIREEDVAGKNRFVEVDAGGTHVAQGDFVATNAKWYELGAFRTAADVFSFRTYSLGALQENQVTSSFSYAILQKYAVIGKVSSVSTVNTFAGQIAEIIVVGGITGNELNSLYEYMMQENLKE